MKTAVIVTTFNRPACLARSLPQIVAAAKEVEAPVLVVDDASSDIDAVASVVLQEIMNCNGSSGVVEMLQFQTNRGLAGALNIGLSYWLADPSIEAIHYFQDDVDVDPLCIAACNDVLRSLSTFLVTGHDAAEHRVHGDGDAGEFGRISPRDRRSCRATHMAARVGQWKRVMPIPSRGVGLPSAKIRDAHHPDRRGTGSGVDWWIVRDSPNRLPVLCVPGLVRSFAHKREDSTWDNESIGGEEPPLHREAILGWVEARK